MTEIDAAIDRIERQIQALQAQVTKLREARDIAKGVLAGSYMTTLAGQATPPRQRKRASNRFTIADAAAQVLQQNGEMHADDIKEALKTFDMTPSKPTLVSGLLRDRENRFILVGNNRFKLNDTPNLIATPDTAMPAESKRGVKMGGLTDETRKAIEAIGNEEFDIFGVINQLGIQNPPLAEMITGDRSKQASLSGTLKRLADELHELVIVKRGKGSSPTIYKLKQAGAQDRVVTPEQEETFEPLTEESLFEKAS
jgi:hypothetical protein